ncbi:MAG: hypothetical protein AAGK14_07375 [Verrucomicrobiota bacterium]
MNLLLAFVIPPTDERTTSLLWAGLIILAFAVALVAVSWWFWRQQHLRAEAYRAFAAESGRDFLPEGDDVTTEPFGRLPLFYKAHRNKLQPAVVRRDGTHNMIMGDYGFIGVNRFLVFFIHSVRWHQTVAIARCRRRQLPLMVVAPAHRSVLEPYGQQGLSRVRFRDRPEAAPFHEKTVLLCREPDQVRELLEGDRLADFIETIVEPLRASRLVLEVQGSWVLIYESSGLARAEEFPWLWEFAEKTADYFQPAPAPSDVS